MNLYQNKNGWLVQAVKLQQDIFFPRREIKRWFGKPEVREEKRYPAGGYIIWFDGRYWSYWTAEDFEQWHTWLG